LTTPLLYLLRPRTPLSHSVAVHHIDLGFLRLSSFWMLQTGNILQSLGYFLPSAYLSSYAVEQIGLSSTIGTLLIAILNATCVPGSIIIGTLNDHFPVSNVILFSTIGSSVAVFLFWGFSSQMGLITIFSITYGFFGGGFSSTWSGIVTELKAEYPALDTGLVFGLMAGGRGIGNVISGPLSAVLFANNGWLRNGKSWGYNTEYGPMIIFTGTTALLGGCGGLMLILMSAKRLSKRPFQKYS
jgi:MFS family permease